MKRSSFRSLTTFVTFVAGVVAGPLVACSAAGDRAGVPDAGAEETTAPDDTPSTPTTSATPVTPTKATDDASTKPSSDDCARAAPSNVCGVAPQCGCAKGHTCAVVDLNGSVDCVTAGNAPMGHPCTATAGCALGLTCIFGTCHPFCDAAKDKTCSLAGTGACVQMKGPNDDDVPNLAVCRVSCKLEDPTSCGGSTNAGVGVCHLDGEGGTDCRRGGSRAVNQTCSTADDCGPGLVCAKNSSTSSCKRWCRVGESDCGAGKTCTGLKTEVKVGDVVYGTCP